MQTEMLHMLCMTQRSLRRCFSLLYHSNAVSYRLAVCHGMDKFCMRALVPPEDFHDVQDSPPDLSVRFGLGELQSAEIEIIRYGVQFQGTENKRNHMLHVRIELLAMCCNCSLFQDTLPSSIAKCMSKQRTCRAFSRLSSCCTSLRPPSAWPNSRYSVATPDSAMQLYQSRLLLVSLPEAISL